MAEWTDQANHAANDVLRGLASELAQAAHQRARIADSPWVSAGHVSHAARTLFGTSNEAWTAQLVAGISLLILGGAIGFWVTWLFTPGEIRSHIDVWVHALVTSLALVAAVAFGIAQRSLRRT